VFPDEASAVQGMADDEVDVVLSPIGLDRTLAEAATAVPFFDVVSNETNGFRYLAFNLRREPMAQQAFRDALGLMVDRQYLANQVLSGGAFPAYTSISPANPIWYDGEIAESLEERTADLTTEQRLSEAIRLLEDSGFTWERRPEFADNAVVAGQGVAFADEPVAPLRILAPGQAFDPLRATYALWIREWLVQLGFDVEVELTDFTTLVNQVFTPTSDGALDYDMFVLGWRLPSPAMPVHHESFWAAKNDTLANNGNNNTGFDDDRFNAFVEEYNAAATFEEAFDLLWEMERIVFEEKPYLVLFDTGITEAYRNDRVSFPFTRTISGIQSLNGMPALVRPAS
jgi:ABC-type transport system substrate-binding protein